MVELDVTALPVHFTHAASLAAFVVVRLVLSLAASVWLHAAGRGFSLR